MGTKTKETNKKILKSQLNPPNKSGTEVERYASGYVRLVRGNVRCIPLHEGKYMLCL